MNYILLVAIFFILLIDKLNICFYFFISVLLHETGHIIVCFLTGNRPQIKFSIFGIRLCNYPNEKVKKLFILLAGPSVNLFIIIFCQYNLSFQFRIDIYVLWIVNIIIFTTNILPIHYLDGGQILGLFIQNKYVRNINDLVSIIFLCTASFIFCNNNLYTLVCISIFIAYYFINQNNLYL